MQIIKNITTLKESLRTVSRPLCLIPTMGALHQGHLSLTEIAKEKANSVAVSIFVNPTQFNDPKDLEKYPRDIEADLKKLDQAGVDLVFIPDVSEIYPANFQSEVKVKNLTQTMEGPNRPGHFEGVCTIVSILFNLFQPDYAVFGEKDFQQLRIIEQMTRDLKLPVEILRGKIYREESGLAMSSRNELLSKDNREKAAIISKTLNLAKEQKTLSELYAMCRELLASIPELEVEYLTIADENTLQPEETMSDYSRIFFAGRIGGVRLIDNQKL